MSARNRTLIIVHDVLGTLFSLEAPIGVLLEEFGSQLGSESDVRRRFGELVVMVRLRSRAA